MSNVPVFGGVNGSQAATVSVPFEPTTDIAAPPGTTLDFVPVFDEKRSDIDGAMYQLSLAALITRVRQQMPEQSSGPTSNDATARAWT